jgi:hypothetical protein
VFGPYIGGQLVIGVLVEPAAKVEPLRRPPPERRSRSAARRAVSAAASYDLYSSAFPAVAAHLTFPVVVMTGPAS